MPEDRLDAIVREACGTAHVAGPIPGAHCRCAAIRAALEQALAAEGVYGGVLVATKARAKAAEAEIERLREERRVLLTVKTKEGLLASEWVMRTAKAEAERDAARDKAIKHEPDCASKPAGCGHDARLPLLCDCGASGN